MTRHAGMMIGAFWLCAAGMQLAGGRGSEPPSAGDRPSAQPKQLAAELAHAGYAVQRVTLERYRDAAGLRAEPPDGGPAELHLWWFEKPGADGPSRSTSVAWQRMQEDWARLWGSPVASRFVHERVAAD